MKSLLTILFQHAHTYINIYIYIHELIKKVFRFVPLKPPFLVNRKEEGGPRARTRKVMKAVQMLEYLKQLSTVRYVLHLQVQILEYLKQLFAV
jgi:hypothetical protein